MKVTTPLQTWADLGPQDKDHPYYILLFGGKVTHGYFGLATLDLAKKQAEELLAAEKLFAAADALSRFAAVYMFEPDGRTRIGEILRRDEQGWQPWK